MWNMRYKKIVLSVIASVLCLGLLNGCGYEDFWIIKVNRKNCLKLFMLHGDTASSIMFEILLPLYQENFRVVLIDFLGNGKSDRVSKFPADIWISQAQQVIALGGAWVAVNTALERPDLIEKVIADSFDGRTLHQNFAENLLKEREYAKHDTYAKQFYEWCQGEDWETVVDLNTQAFVECAKNKIPLFSKPLESLTVPILFIGSLQDDMCRKDILEEYTEMKKLVKNGSIHTFDTGGHPAIATNGEKFADIVLNFLND